MIRRLWMLVPAAFVLYAITLLQITMGIFWPLIEQEKQYNRDLKIECTTKIWYRCEIVYWEEAKNITLDSMQKEKLKAEYIIKQIINKP